MTELFAWISLTALYWINDWVVCLDQSDGPVLD